MTPLTAPLISAVALRNRLAAGEPIVVLDTGFDLVDKALGERQYLEGHLPGAHYAHVEADLSGETTGADGVFRGRHPLPERAAFAWTLAAWGVSPATPVVVYDRQGGMYAARGWWMLKWVGHDNVAVLDGGIAAWAAAGGALEPGRVARGTPAAPYPLGEPRVATLDAAALVRRLGRHPLVDARAPERYRGEVEPLDTQAGHIPGASNRFFKLNLADDGRFKDAAQLRAEWTALIGTADPAAVTHHCGSGVTACHNLLAMEVAGLPGSVLYPGSWSEWSSDPARPVAVG